MRPVLCSECRLPQRYCVCAQMQSTRVPFQIIVVRHPKERHKASNTAQIAKLCLRDLHIVDVPLSPRLPQEFLPHAGDHILYPPDLGVPIASKEDLPQRMYVIDGSWKQARKIYKKISVLQELAHISIKPRAIPPPRIRTPVHSYGMSTMEAISGALEFYGYQKEGQCIFDSLCHFIEARRKVTGIKVSIPSGMSFSQVRTQEAQKQKENPSRI